MSRVRGGQWIAFALLAGFTTVAVAAPATQPAVPLKSASLSLGEKAIIIDAGAAGQFDLSYPSIGTKGGGHLKTLSLERAGDGKSTSISFEDGATAKVKLVDAQQCTITFAQVPAAANDFTIEMFIPISYGNGGTYTLGGKGPKPFPADKPAKPFLFQGQSEQIKFTSPSGIEFGMTPPESFSYQELTDNREWNWAIYHWRASTPLHAGQEHLTFPISLGGSKSGVKPKVLIDRYGQFAAAQFPEKVKSDDDLTGDVARDQAYYGSLTAPAIDNYGGLPGSGEKYGLKKTGFFHVGDAAGKQVLVTPDGNVFFQLGVCGGMPMDDYTLVKGREGIYESLPAHDGPLGTAYDKKKGDGVMSFYVANLIRKYGKPFVYDDQLDRWIDRLHKWGFNSGGAWSFGGPVPAKKNCPAVQFLPLDSWQLGTLNNGHIWDPFAKNVEAKMDEAFSKRVAANANDPFIIGYFSDNEPPLEDVSKIVPTLKAKSGSKQRLVELLKETYPTIDAFNTAWNAKVDSFDDLAATPLNVSTEAANHDMQAFFKLFMERRYELIDTCFRKVDGNHIWLGDRWTPGTANNKVVAEAGGKHFDVVSVNYYSTSIELTFLKRIHEWTGNKPLLLSEFDFTGSDQGLPGGALATQADRGEAYRSYVETAASTGYVVGIEWFEGLDQAPTGRWFQGFNGESGNTGLVNVADRPYLNFLDQVTKGNDEIYDVLFAKQPPYVSKNARFNSTVTQQRSVVIPHLVGAFKNDAGHSEFPTRPPEMIGVDRIVMGTSSTDFEATWRVAWDENNLYLYVEVIDPTPMKNDFSPSNIWNGDAVELFVGSQDLDEGGAMKFSDRHVLLRGAPSDDKKLPAYIGNATEQTPVQTIVVPSSDGRGYTLKAAIPFSALSITPQAGTKLRFDLGIDDSTDGVRRARQSMWNGTQHNSEDRTAWGAAELVP